MQDVGLAKAEGGYLLRYPFFVVPKRPPALPPAAPLKKRGLMSVCLCNLSADAVLELAAQNKIDLEPAAPDPTFFSVDPNMAYDTLGDLAYDLPKPIELMVGSPKARRNASGVVCHVWRSRLPRGSFFAIDDGVYITSPECTLAQQAGQLHQANLCQMLGRYMGTWTPADGPTGQGDRAPLTSPEAVRDYVRELGNAPGASNLKLALAYTCEGAASAPETSLQLVLCLPPELHGLGISQPTMNYEVELSSEAQIMYPRNAIRIDLCWRRKHFGLEYQGEGHAKQLGEDYARCFAAREEGYELWYLAKEQLESARQMRYIGREVAKRVDCSVDEGLWPTNDELQDLLDVLAGKRHPKPVSRDEMRRRRTRIRALRRAAP